MNMKKSNRQQTVQMITLMAALVVFALIILSLASCRSSSYSASDEAYLAAIQPALGGEVDSDFEERTLISVGRNICKSIAAGVTESAVIDIISDQYTEAQTTSLYNAARDNYCPR